MSRVTMKDIAEVMGVSVMTVSNAFNRPDQLSEDLRGRILARAEKMGYGGPNAAARQLRSGRTNAYGVLFSERLSYAFNDPYSVLWLSGLSRALEDAHAAMVLLSVQGGADADVEALRNASIDGVAGRCAAHPAMRVAIARGLPVVSTDPEDPHGSWVTIDDRLAGEQVGRYLRRLGHTDVMVVVPRHQTGAPTPPEASVADYRATLEAARGAGFYDTWARLTGIIEGLGDVAPRIVTPGWNARESGRRAGGLALDRQDRPTAIVCLSDVLAFGVLDAMAGRGVVPGREVSVTGFDDLPDAARAGLTTVRQPIVEKGRLVGELLLDQGRQPRRLTLDHALIVRSSTGPAPLH